MKAPPTGTRFRSTHSLEHSQWQVPEKNLRQLLWLTCRATAIGSIITTVFSFPHDAPRCL